MSQDDGNYQGVDLGEFLEFYLLDSQEQIEKLGAGLLQLEKEGGNVGLINDLFRSAHSLKGASGTMGFTPIVALTHAAEDLLDRLRQGKMEVSLEMIDILLAMTDRVKAMLSQVEQRQEISIDYEDVVSSMKGLLNGEKPVQSVSSQSANANEGVLDEFIPLDFALSQVEREKVNNAHIMGYGVFQIDIKLAPNTMMRAVRAVMATQRLEGMGTVIKLLPSVEDLEVGNAEGFSFLVLCDEPIAEMKRELLEISELIDVAIHPYPESEGAGVAEETTVDEKIQEIIPEAIPKVETVVTPAVPLPNPENFDKPKGMVVSPTAPTTDVSSSGEGNTQVHTIRVDTARMDNL
ncbi:MAG: Hpt domain-containing protein, partial [Bacillota bacterium]|nr:Hpt domain-containing protein [Bacillota bacterium]